MTVCSCCVCGLIYIYDSCLDRNALGNYCSCIWNCIGLVFLTFAGYTHRRRRNVMTYIMMVFKINPCSCRQCVTNAFAGPLLFCLVGCRNVLTTSYYASTPHVKTIAQDAFDIHQQSRTAREKNREAQIP